MRTYSSFRHQLRRSLFMSTILPVFLVIIVGLASFFAIYFWIEQRTIQRHTIQSYKTFHQSEQNIKQSLSSYSTQFKSLNLNNTADKTTVKRHLLKIVHNQKGTIYYNLTNSKSVITNNYEHKDFNNMYLLHKARYSFKDRDYTLSMYIADTPLLTKIKHESGQYILIKDRFDNILFTNNDSFEIGSKFTQPGLGFITDTQTLGQSGNSLMIYKNAHDTFEYGIYLFIIMVIIFILLVLFGFISAHNIAKRQTKDIETILQRIS